MSPLTAHLVPPAGYARMRVVGSFAELAGTTFGAGVNALCWPRGLRGDFGEVVRTLEVPAGITSIDEARLRRLALSDAGTLARDFILEDLQRLRARELAPVLDAIRGYVQEAETGPVETHVQSWHVDSATVEADTWLCTYYGRSSEGLRNEEAQRRVELPETRAALLALYGGEDDDGFQEYLHEQYYDLHYVPVSGARTWAFGVGNLWRVACEYPGCPVPPCIHRAPATVVEEEPRLLLIS